MEKTNLEQAFIDMIRQHERVIYKVCSFYVSPDFSLADLYQEVICNLWVGFSKFKHESSVSTWMYRVALNTCISSIRKQMRRPVNTSLVHDLSDSLIEDESLSESIQEMYHLVNQLKSIEKIVVLLYLEDKSYQEIADITGLTVTNVATKLKRSREKLRKMSNY